MILEITECCPEEYREDIQQDLAYELCVLVAKNTTIDSKTLRRHLILYRNRYLRKYQLGGITQAPADPKTLYLDPNQPCPDCGGKISYGQYSNCCLGCGLDDGHGIEVISIEDDPETYHLCYGGSIEEY